VNAADPALRSAQATSPPGDEPDSSLRDLIGVLQRRATILVIVIVALPAAAIGYSLRAEKQYTATAKLLFRDPGFDQRLLGGPVLAPSVDPAREAATNVGLVSLDTVSRRAADSIKNRPLTPAEIRRKITISAQGQSNVIAVSATDPTPGFAARLANTIGRQYIDFRRDADRSKIDQAIGLVRGQLARLGSAQRKGREGRSLRQQVEQLGVLGALQTGNAELVQPAERPRTPSSPKLIRNTLLALILAIAIGAGLALLRERLDRRLRDGADAAALLGRPVLGVIPDSTSLNTGGGDALELAGPEAEAFRTLRANLRYYDIDRDIRSLLITSSAPRDGKSTVARYLAATAAAAGVRVVLVEADLRRPTLTGRHPALHAIGLSELLSDQATLETVIQQLPVSLGGRPTGALLDVIAAGSPPPNPTDLLESDRMRLMLGELDGRYDLVVVDSSPITVVPDSIPVLRHVSGVLIVMRESQSTAVGARELRDQLALLGVVPLGLVMNATKRVDVKGYDGYYSYVATPVSEPDTTNGSGPAADNGHRPSRRERRRGAGHGDGTPAVAPPAAG
jgi:capsular exopolysaccharide synthesis family protein